MIIDVCPVCGDFDIGDWCNRCNVPTVQKNTSSTLTPDEEKEAEDYYARLYEEYIQGLIDEEYKPTQKPGE